MSGLDDPGNYSGSIGVGLDPPPNQDPRGEIPPDCFNLFDSDGYFWFDNTGGPDISIFYVGDTVDNPFFCLWKVTGDNSFGIAIDLAGPGGGGAFGGATTPGESSGFFVADWGAPITDFSCSPGTAFAPDGTRLGIKFSPTEPGGGGGGGGDEVVIPSTFVLFPECPSYEFTAQPQYLVKLNNHEGGFESVKRRWPRPISVYTAFPIGESDEVDVQTILNFWHAMGGRKTAFLIKDWTDFKSCQVQDDVSAVDQPFEVVTLLDITTAYQLTKLYTVGPITQVREITQPKADTIIVANESGDPQTDFVLDAASGLLKPGAGFTGTPTSWGGEFYVPVRFDSELTMTVVDQRIQSATFTVREKRIKLANTFPGSP